MACSGRGDSIPFMVFPATLLAWVRAAPLKPSVSLLFPLVMRTRMSERSNKVTLVLEPDFGDRLASLATMSHVWVIDTPANQTAASQYWAQNPNSEIETGITTFKSSENESPWESCLNMLETIDLHHGEYSSNPPYSVLEVIGAPLTEELKSAIEGLGFRSFEPMIEGFRASRE